MYKLDNFENWKETSLVLDWKILAFSGHMEMWALKDKVRGVVTKEGFTLEREDSEKWVIEHPKFDSQVEISFKGSVTTNGRRYALCFHSESFGIKKRDARMQKKLYYAIFSIIPPTWRKEAYWRKNGDYVLVYMTYPPLRLKRRRKY